MEEDIKTLLMYLTDYIARFEDLNLDLYDLDRDKDMRSDVVSIQRKYNLHKFNR